MRSRGSTPLAVAWASPPADHPSAPTPDLFLAQIRGDSMQPTLHDGQWCLFAKGFSADPSSDTAVEAVLLEPLPTLAGSRGRAKA